MWLNTENYEFKKIICKRFSSDVSKNKPEDVNVEATMSFVVDVLKHVENEGEEEHETNHQCVGI